MDKLLMVGPTCAISAALILCRWVLLHDYNENRTSFDFLSEGRDPCAMLTNISLLGLCLQMLNTIRREILSGCKIVFSRVFPTKFQPENHQLWKLAEQLGASCSTELDPSVTHVVGTDTGTQKAQWAVRKNKFLVHPRWIEAASYLWKRLPEDQFLVTPQTTSKHAEESKHTTEEQKALGVMGNGFVLTD